jgi:transcriptional regulator with XRE-family HTH domain
MSIGCYIRTGRELFPAGLRWANVTYMRHSHGPPSSAIALQTPRSTASYVTLMRQVEGIFGAYDAEVAADEPEERPGIPLAKLIKDARALKGWTQEKLAIEAGVTRQTVSRYEGGHTNPMAKEARRLCRALDIDAREIPIALGYVTRDELGLPPKAPAIHPELLRVHRFLIDEEFPGPWRTELLADVKSAVDRWLKALRMALHVPEPPHEPSHVERGTAKPRRNLPKS